MSKLDAWKNYRNRWVYLKGKKGKLRKYIYLSARIMRFKGGSNWSKVNHVQNYKNALQKYGFAGLKIYEDYFYKGVPLPEKRSIIIKIGLLFAPFYARIVALKIKVLKVLKLK